MAKRKMKRSENFVVIGLIVAILAIGIIFVLTSTMNNQTVGTTSYTTTDEIPRVLLDEAVQAHTDGTAVFVDVRPKESFDLSHITNSINIPLADLGNRLTELDKDEWIITYCT